MEEVPNLINMGPTNPIKILNQHDFLKTLYMSFKWYFWQTYKNLDDGTGASSF